MYVCIDDFCFWLSAGTNKYGRRYHGGVETVLLKGHICMYVPTSTEKNSGNRAAYLITMFWANRFTKSTFRKLAISVRTDFLGGRQCRRPASWQQTLGKQSNVDVQAFGWRSKMGGGGAVHSKYSVTLKIHFSNEICSTERTFHTYDNRRSASLALVRFQAPAARCGSSGAGHLDNRPWASSPCLCCTPVHPTRAPPEVYSDISGVLGPK